MLSTPPPNLRRPCRQCRHRARHSVGKMLPVAPASYPRNVPDVLIATDSSTVFYEVRSAVEEPGVVLRWAHSGRSVRPALRGGAADVVSSAVQVGCRGGLDIGMQVGLEMGSGRVGGVGVLLLVDR